jgi:tRNA G46 methylase TrmB
MAQKENLYISGCSESVLKSHNARTAANTATNLVGIDVDLVSIQQAHRTITEHNLKTISFNVGDGYELVCQT